jgi:hypothetical protein
MREPRQGNDNENNCPQTLLDVGGGIPLPPLPRSRMILLAFPTEQDKKCLGTGGIQETIPGNIVLVWVRKRREDSVTLSGRKQ